MEAEVAVLNTAVSKK